MYTMIQHAIGNWITRLDIREGSICVIVKHPRGLPMYMKQHETGGDSNVRRCSTAKTRNADFISKKENKNNENIKI